MIKIAVIGTGPAAFSLVQALLKSSQLEIHVFEHGPELISPTAPQTKTEAELKPVYDQIYTEVKSEFGLKFPPQKRHFKEPLPSYFINKKNRFPVSKSLGGLSNYWGATMLPMTENECLEANLDPDEMKTYYSIVADLVGISGRRDELSSFYQNEYSNRPPLKILKGLEDLSQTINRNHSDNFDFYSGINRIALETSPKSESACINCGECMVGCLKNSIFNSKHFFKKLALSKRIVIHHQKVLQLKQLSTSAEVITETDQVNFDSVFLCSGAVGSAEIILRSFLPNQKAILSDNSICQIPILNFNSESDSDLNKESYFSLSQVVATFGKKGSRNPIDFAQMQFYPNFDFLWRSAIPESLWSLAKPLVSLSRDRLIWGRLYTHGDVSYHYDLTMSKTNELSISLSQPPKKSVSSDFINGLSQHLSKGNFKCLSFAKNFAKTSSHLAVQFDDSFLVEKNGQIEKNIYVCDGAYFKKTPTTSLTFTIMANSYRIGEGYVKNC